MKVNYYLEVQLLCLRAKWFLASFDGAKSGGMSSSNFKAFFETIDYNNLLPRSPGVVPFTMFDGYGSWFELPFI